MQVTRLRAVIDSTLREVWRNPSSILTLFSLGGLLFCIAVIAQALSRSGEAFSALGAMTTSAGLVAAALAGSLGVRSADPSDPLGPASEVVLGHGEHALRWGRWIGTLLSGSILVILPCALILLVLENAEASSSASALLGLALEVVALSAFFAGLGGFLGSRLPTVAAYVLLVAAVVALRFGLPNWTTDSTEVGHALPDLLRIADHLRVGESPTAALAAFGLVLQGAAFALASRMRT